MVIRSCDRRLDVRYVEIPGYGHVDAIIGYGAAIDVFDHIVEFLNERSAVHSEWP